MLNSICHMTLKLVKIAFCAENINILTSFRIVIMDVIKYVSKSVNH